jgi:3-deoxy-D-manno-octulosonate 8-phosphate phosphatase (KDO 8-P phosphatase)
MRVGDISKETIARAAKVRMILLDSDGVLTDGAITYCSDGCEIRSFHVHDGFGIRLARKAGLTLGIISGRASPVLEKRAAELGITEVHQRVLDKAGRLDEMLVRFDMTAEEVCFVGDDLIDLSVMRRVGFAAAPSDAQPAVREAAHYVTEHGGGQGAVREVIEIVLRASGRLDEALQRFLK